MGEYTLAQLNVKWLESVLPMLREKADEKKTLEIAKGHLAHARDHVSYFRKAIKQAREHTLPAYLQNLGAENLKALEEYLVENENRVQFYEKEVKEIQSGDRLEKWKRLLAEGQKLMIKNIGGQVENREEVRDYCRRVTEAA